MLLVQSSATSAEYRRGTRLTNHPGVYGARTEVALRTGYQGVGLWYRDPKPRQEVTPPLQSLYAKSRMRGLWNKLKAR